NGAAAWAAMQLPDAPRLVILDWMMPEMDGIEVCRRIRTLETDLPPYIIMLTSKGEKTDIVEGLAVGADDYLSKPFDPRELCARVNVGRRMVEMRAVLAAKEAEKAQMILESYAKEMELIKYREKYNITQQENAFRKELNIIKDDLFLKKIDVVNNRGETVEWVIDLYYKPMDILSGDSYSIREIEEGRVLIYIADAMGKGLAASVTSILSTSFVNLLVNEAKEGSDFNFRKFVDTYSTIIRRELIEEEILCVKFIFLDLINETMDAVICAMPPALCHAADNTIVRIENNNLPLMVYPAEMKIDRYDLSGFHKILAHTDGLNESFRNDDSLYGEYLEEDFRKSERQSDFLDKFNKAVEKLDDDVTFIFMRRMNRNPKWTKVFTIGTR